MKEQDYYMVRATYNSEFQEYNEAYTEDTLEEAIKTAKEMMVEHMGKRKRKYAGYCPDDETDRPIVRIEVHKEWAEENEWETDWYYAKRPEY